MVRPCRRMQVALGLLLLVLIPLSACKKKEAQPPEPGAEASAEKTRPYVTVEDVKVRSGPGTRHKIIAEIKANTRVNVAGQEGGWLRVVSRQGRPPGYIDQRFAKPMAPDEAARADSYRGTYSSTADVPVREGPGPHYKAVARIAKDTHITVVGAEGDWLKVQSKRGNPPGYIESRYADRISD
jgi:uncharacterized protein YgiM (DUF1202 family)